MNTASASQLARIHQCPGSVRLSEGVTQAATPEMRAGTLLHDDICKTWKDRTHTPDPENAEAVAWAVALLDELAAKGYVIEVERSLAVETSGGMTITGTADVVATLTAKDDPAVCDEIMVIDWKAQADGGRSEDYRDQLETYGYLAAAWLNAAMPRRVVAATAYPRQQRMGELLTLDVGDIARRLNRTGREVAIALEGAANRVSLTPGPECWRCPARTVCPAYRSAVSATIAGAADDDVAALLRNVKDAGKFLDDVKAAIKLRVQAAGGTITTPTGEVYMKRMVRTAKPSAEAILDYLRQHEMSELVADIEREFATLPAVVVEYPDLRRAKK